MRHTLTLSNVYESDLNKAGFRSLDVARIFQEKYKVPLSFVIPHIAFEEFMSQSRLLVSINSILREVNVDDKKSLDGAYARIKGLFSKASIPSEFLEQLEESYNALSVKDDVLGADDFLKDESPVVNLFISPNYESDLDSFRGVFLNVKGFKSFLDSVKSCWLSLFSPEEIRFRRKHGISDFKVGILVQRLVVPDVCVEAYSAGLGEDDNILVREYLGLPDITKSSSKDVYSVSKDYLKVVSANKLNQEFKLVRGPSSGILAKRYLKGKGFEQKLSDLQASDVARLVKRFRSLLGVDFKAFFLLKKDSVFCSLISRVPSHEEKPGPALVEEAEDSFDPDADETSSSGDEFVGEQDFAVSPSQESQGVVEEDKDDDFILPGDGSYEDVLSLEPVFNDVVLKRYEEAFGVPAGDPDAALKELSQRVPLADKDDLLLFVSLKDKIKQGSDVDLDTLFRVSESVKRFIGEDS